MLTGDDNRAILCYNEVASIFFDKKNKHFADHKQDNKNIAICYNNIACIYAKQREFEKRDLYFEKAIQIAMESLKNRFSQNHNNETIESLRFKLACRFYNQGYALYAQYFYQQKNSP